MKSINSNFTLKAHKLTNVFFLIIFIPALLLSVLTIFTIYNTRISGGIPNTFGYYSIEMQDNSFYEKGTNQLFKSIDAKTLEKTINDRMNELSELIEDGKLDADKARTNIIVAYYSEEPETTTHANSTDWTRLSLDVKLHANDTENTTTSQYKIVEIAFNTKIVTTTDGQEYRCYSYYTSNNENAVEVYDNDNLLFAVDIFAISLNSSGFIADTITFVSSFDGFLTLIIVPCVLLLVLKFMSLGFYKRYEKMDPKTRKAKIVVGEENDRLINSYGTSSYATRNTSTKTNSYSSKANSSTKPKTPPPPPPPKRK